MTIRTICVGGALVFAFALCLGLAACGGEEESTPPVPTGPVIITIQEEKSGGSTALSVGHTLRVELEANPTTGYLWSVAEVDEAVLQPPAMEEYRPPDGDALGAGGVSVWEFKAVGAGQTTIKLVYQRPGDAEAGTPPEKTFTFTVIVG